MGKKKKKGTPEFCMTESLHTFELKRAILTGISAAVFLCAVLIPMFAVFKKGLFVLSFALSGICTGLDLLRSIRERRGAICPELVVLLICAVCFFTAGFGDAACVMLFYSISALAESVAFACEQSTAWSPMGAVPARATVSDEEGTYSIKASKLRAGDICIVDNGCVVPADGTVVEGMSETEIDAFAFEAVTKTVVPGSYVLSGSVNNGDAIRVEAAKDYGDSFAQTVYSSFSKSVESDTAEERLTSKFYNYFAIAVSVIVLIVCVIVPVFKGEWMQKAFAGAATLLLICPFCVKGSLSIATFKAVETIFSRGAIFKDAGILNGLATVSELICNKTGTVTEKEYSVADIQTQGVNEKNFLILVSRIECCSDHPIAKAIRDYCGTDRADNPEGFSATEIEGKGIVADIGGNSFMFGNASLLSEQGISCLIPDKSGTAVHLAVNGNYCGYVLLENRTRQSSYDAVETLRALGVRKLTMLTNDLRSIARPVAAALNFDSIKSELTTEDKVKSVRYIAENKNSHTCVAYAGNGNDELIPGSEADISIGTGMLDSESGIDGPDVAVLTPGLESLTSVIKNAKQSRNVSRINFIVSSAVRAALLVFTLKGLIGPAAVSIILSLASLFTFFNTVSIYRKY